MSGWQPNLRLKGQSAEDAFSTRILTYMREPGASRAMFLRSSLESVANMRTPFS